LARLLLVLGAFESIDALAMRVQRDHGLDWLGTGPDRRPPWERGDRAPRRLAAARGL
jgi:hypothetical protein